MDRVTRVVAVAAVLAFVGLGVAYFAGLFEGKPCNISGAVTRDGKPIEWPSTDDQQFLVLFVRENRRSNEDPYAAETDPATGTYKVNGIKSGRYRVAIHMFYRGRNDNLQDILGNKYDPSNTPLVYDVTDDGQVIDIDVPAE